MASPRFLQIHTLHSYPAALLNRDDSGLAKRMPFGGEVRTRISSQCLKRHWRVAQDEFAIHGIPGVEAAVRSRNVVERRVIAPLREQGSVSDDILAAVEDAFNVGVYGDSGRSESGRQPLLLGLPEVEYLREKAADICAEHFADAEAAKTAAVDLFSQRRGEGNNFRAFRDAARLPGGLEGALFGRMVTSDAGANIDAAVHVAHAFTVHREESESDYFSVVDDLRGEDEDAGAAHIGDMELTAGLFYGYVVVDVPGLVSNLEGCEAGEWEGGRPRARRQGGRAPCPPHRDRLARREARLNRALCLRRLDVDRSRKPPTPQPGQRVPHSRQGAGQGRRRKAVHLPRQAGRVLRRKGRPSRGVGRGLRNPWRGAAVHGRLGILGRRRRPRRNGGVGHAPSDPKLRIAAHGLRRRDHR